MPKGVPPRKRTGHDGVIELGLHILQEEKMGRFVAEQAQKGSQKWIQSLVNDHPTLLNDRIIQSAKLPEGEHIDWLSPLATDNHAEYRDQAFLDLLKIALPKRTLQDFWPERGPQWDALGRAEGGTVFFVEAKSHIPEIISHLGAKSEKSKDKILASLNETKRYLNSPQKSDWSSPFYQYANRIAHLYLLRVLNSVPAYLVFVYFLNDKDMGGPNSKEEWLGAIRLVHAYFGLGRNRLEPFILKVFCDVKDLA
jgi:hypothetical protein